MIEVFITNFNDTKQAKRTTGVLGTGFADVRFNVDLDDSKQKADFACSHTVLRAEGIAIDIKRIITASTSSVTSVKLNGCNL